MEKDEQKVCLPVMTEETRVCRARQWPYCPFRGWFGLVHPGGSSWPSERTSKVLHRVPRSVLSADAGDDGPTAPGNFEDKGWVTRESGQRWGISPCSRAVLESHFKILKTKMTKFGCRKYFREHLM